MRIRLNLGYVLIKSCDATGPARWVGWCPELNVMSQGGNPATALWMAKAATRIAIEEDVRKGDHPLRRRDEVMDDVHTDVDYPAYEEFLTRTEDAWDKWSSTVSPSNIPEGIDRVFVQESVVVETLGRECLISDSTYFTDYNYVAGRRVEIEVMTKMTYRLPIAEVGESPTLEVVQAHLGNHITEIVSVKPD